MRITNVALVKPDVYQVTFSPNWFECLLNYGPKKRLYSKDTFESRTVLVDDEGNRYERDHRIHKAVDRHIVRELNKEACRRATEELKKQGFNVTINSN